jgi:hypothetical protein
MPKITARKMLESAASQRFLGSLWRRFERYRCSAPYTLRKTARVLIAKFVGVAFKLGTNFAIAKDTSHSMPLVWL